MMFIRTENVGLLLLELMTAGLLKDKSGFVIIVDYSRDFTVVIVV